MTSENAKHLQLRALEHVAFNKRIPTMLVGEPGVGKTAVIRAIADTRKFKTIVLLGSQMEGADVTGLPQGRKMGQTASGTEIFGTVYLSTYWQLKILQDKKVVLFLDEYTNAPPNTRAALLTIIQDRVFPNGQKIPDETVIISAMNPPDEAADGFELDLPTKNRFFFMHWDPPKHDWIEGIKTNWGKNDFDPAEKTWRVKLSQFINENPSLLHVMPKLDETPNDIVAPNASKREVMMSAWPSRRSWENVAKAITGLDDVSTRSLVIEGLVGPSASTKFQAWIQKNDVISPREVMNDPDSLDWSTLTIDDGNVLFREVTAITENDPSEETISQALKVFDKAVDEDVMHLAVPHLSAFLKKTNFTKVGLKKDAIELSGRYRSLGVRK